MSQQHPSTRYKHLRFRIGDVFPPEDPIARWATVLSMAANNTVYLNIRLIEGDLPPELNIYYLRLVAAHFYEAVDWLKRTRTAWADVDEFITDRLSPRHQQIYDDLLAYASQSHPLHQMLKRSRHTFFHYPVMDPGRDASGHGELMDAMNEARDLRSSISMGDMYASFRALYADEVGVQFVSGDGDDPTELLTGLREAMFPLIEFTEAVLLAHLARPGLVGAVTTDREPRWRMLLRRAGRTLTRVRRP